MIGKTIGKYRFVEKIGRGGMGVVYRAVDETLDRPVAVKVISPELVEEELVRRFRAEAQTLAKVNHPNIATVYELFRDGDQLMMVMELVSGQTFEQLIERGGPLPVERAVALVAQVLDALGHAHGVGIVHRDLKPANLMLTDSGVAKVMDFGIARVIGAERMTSDGLMVGTPAYMAPEQVRGEDVDGRADLYAIGMVLYRMLTGKLPFKADTAVAMIQSQLNATPAPARELRPDLPGWLDTVLMRALAKRTDDRFQSADEFRRALGALAPAMDDLTIAPRSATRGPVTPSAAVPAPAAPGGGPATTTLVMNRSHLAVAGALVVLLVVGIGVLAWLSLRRPAATGEPVGAPAAAADQASNPSPTPTEAGAGPAPGAPGAVPPESPAAAGAAAVPATTAVIAPPKAAPPSKPAGSLPAAAASAPDRGAAPASAGTTAARRGRAATGPASPATAAPAVPEVAFPPTVVRDVRAVISSDGRDSKLVDAILTFSERSITAADERNGTTLKTFPYDAVKRAVYSRARNPRGPGGADLQVPGGVPQGNIFSRGPRLWVLLETADDRLLLRLDPQAVRPLLELLQQRTKAPLERFEDP